MRPAWRLAINNLSARRNRTALLVASVALCAALIVAVACAMTTLKITLQQRINETVGAADARVVRQGAVDPSIELGVLKQIDAWDGVKLAVGKLDRIGDVRLKRTDKVQRVTLVGVDQVRESAIRPLVIVQGEELPRAVDGSGKADAPPQIIVLEENLALKLGAIVGEDVRVSAGTRYVTLRVHGIVKQPGLSAIFDRFNAYVPLPTLWQMCDIADTGSISDIDIVLNSGINAETWVKAAQARIKDRPDLKLQPSSKVNSGFEQTARGNEIGFILASTLAFMAAAFIIATGLTTNVTERTRELSIIRCIGASKRQLAGSQILVGLLVGGMGGLVGVPLGIAGTALLVAIFRSQLPTGFSISWLGVGLGIAGSLIAGAIGGVWPAISASRVSPMEGLSVRSRPIRSRWVWISLIAGLLTLGVHALIITTLGNNDTTFWLYVVVAAPCLLLGYVLVSVPVTMLMAKLLSTLISRVLALPGHRGGMLRRTLAATPYRHGYTAGAMMLGLALMVSIWTNGRAVLHDWLDQMQVPDAFAVGIFPDPEGTLKAIRAVEGVRVATPISLTPVSLPDNLAQGISAINKLQTSFIGFEPDAFFEMTSLKWEQPETAAGVEAAKARLKQGGAILVAKEFLVNRDMKIGSRLPVTLGDQTHTFEIVGVVHSPGLDVVSKFYRVGEGIGDQAVNSVFGTRQDLKDKFNFSAWTLVQIGFTEAVKSAKPAAATANTPSTSQQSSTPGSTAQAPSARAASAPRTPDQVLAEVRAIGGLGILEVGSAVEIKARISEVIGGAMLVASVVAIGSMLIGCFAVANLIIAGIQTRQFEFGVLRAVGAQRWLLGRLVIGESLVIAAAACVLGTAYGLQGGWGGQKLYQITIGLVLGFSPPWGAIAYGCLAVTFITLLATLPAAMRLVRKPPRELLGAMKG